MVGPNSPEDSPQFSWVCDKMYFLDVVLVARLESFRALKLSKSESFRALKLSKFETFRALKLSNFESNRVLKY